MAKDGQGGSVIVYATASTLGDKHLTPETLAVAEEAKRQYAEGRVKLGRVLVNEHCLSLALPA